MKFVLDKELAELLKISTRTIRRDVASGLPVAEIRARKGGGKAQNLFDVDAVKRWYLDNKSGKAIAKYILDNCPPAEIKKERKQRDDQAKLEALELKAETKQVERTIESGDTSADDLLAMQARLAQMEKKAFDVWTEYLKEENPSPTVAATLEQSYTRIANRRQGLEKDLPAIM